MTATVNALRAAGFEKEAARLAEVSTDRVAWDAYNIQTFHAHASVLSGMHLGEGKKLRYLTYTTKDTQKYWEECRASGAVLL
jgi:hypothetical protein